MAMTTTDDVGSDPTEAPDVAGLTAAACLFRGFADPSRMAILQHLALGEHRVVDLTAHLGLAQSTVSTHLACLRDCGLVAARPQGRATVYSLRHEEALMDLWAAAERLLALTGDAVTLCPTYGTDAAPASAGDAR
jgi:DNA-binding transcriptional ArsR family regulator